MAKALYDAKVGPSTLLPKQVGNMYTASLYAALLSVIHNKHATLVIIPLSSCHCVQHHIFPNAWFHVKYCILQEGQRIMMFSYGSGMTATVFSLKAKQGQHPFSLSNIASVLNVPKKLEARHEVNKTLLFFCLKFRTYTSHI